MISESRVPENGTPGLMSGDWRRSTVSGPQRLQFDAWTAPDLSATAPALDSTAQRFLVSFSAVSNHFRPRRHRLTASTYRQFRTQAHTARLDITRAGVCH